MKFIQLQDNSWYELNTERNRIYNLRGGFSTISNDDIKTLKQVEFKDWHDLYIHTDYNPLKSLNLSATGWISPTGDFYRCEAHEVDAEYIYQLIYGGDYCEYGDKLIEKGWLKVTDSLLFDIYMANGYYDKMASKEQENTFNSWFKIFC